MGVLLTAVFTLYTPAQASSRRLNVGEQIPSFSVKSLDGKEVSYEPENGKVLVAVFLTTGQSQSVSAAEDIANVIAKIAPEPNDIDVAVFVSDPNDRSFFRSADGTVKSPFNVIADAEYKLWGKFGIIAAPTVIIGGKDGKAAWARPGYGYDFKAAFDLGLRKALGLPVDETAHPEIVKVIKNNSISNRASRHLAMARMLKEKGRIDSAVSQLEKAYSQDPNSAAIAFEYAELLCVADNGKKALEVIERVEVETKTEEVRVAFISGWANRIEANYDEAIRNLLLATSIDLRSARGFFELGQAYEATGDAENALLAYKKALRILLKDGAGGGR
jgi:Tfp pilus assembly protein PilF